MASKYFSTLLLSTLVLFTSAIPTPQTQPHLATRQQTTQKWHIPNLSMHMMSSSTGIPGNPPWPQSSQFNSSIEFDIEMPSSSSSSSASNNTTTTTTIHCNTQFTNGTLPQGLVLCGDAGLEGEGTVLFGMVPYTELGNRRAEMSFELYIWRIFHRGANMVLVGSTPVTANDPSEQTSYLTCLLGAPLDGLRCRIGSYLSVRRELVVEGVAE